MTVVDPVRDDRGWRFFPGEPDPVNGFEFLVDAYRLTKPDFSDRVTVPLLWDKQENRAVNNESSEVIRMLNSEWDEWGRADVDLYPEDKRQEIDELNERIYNEVNNGVYRAGFATSQNVYEKAFQRVFFALDWLEEKLAGSRFLTGPAITEADWREPAWVRPELGEFAPPYRGQRSSRIRSKTSSMLDRRRGVFRRRRQTRRACHRGRRAPRVGPDRLRTTPRWRRWQARACRWWDGAAE